MLPSSEDWFNSTALFGDNVCVDLGASQSETKDKNHIHERFKTKLKCLRKRGKGLARQADQLRGRSLQCANAQDNHGRYRKARED